MPTPITPEAFIARGVAADKAAAFAAQHNAAAGIRTDALSAEVSAPPAPRPAVPSAPPAGMTADQARLEIDSIKSRRASGEISDRAWRRQYEPRVLELAGTAQSLKDYRAAAGPEKSAMLAELEAGQTQAAFEASVDAVDPPKSPTEYLIPGNPTTPEEITADTEMRQAMFAAGIPREMGNMLASEVEGTAKVILNGTPAEVDAYMAQQEASLRRMFGPQYDARVELTRSFLREQAANSPTLAGLLQHRPELFASWQVVQSLSQLAESRRRSKANG